MALYNKVYVTNSFSINMLDRKNQHIHFIPCSLESAMAHLDSENVVSAIGHPDTARIVSSILGIDLPASRINVKMGNNDMVLVAQYAGPRLPEGAKELPEGATIEFWITEFSRL